MWHSGCWANECAEGNILLVHTYKGRSSTWIRLRSSPHASMQALLLTWVASADQALMRGVLYNQA